MFPAILRLMVGMISQEFFGMETLIDTDILCGGEEECYGSGSG